MKTVRNIILVMLVCLSLIGCEKDVEQKCFRCLGRGIIRDSNEQHSYITCPGCNGSGYRNQ